MDRERDKKVAEFERVIVKCDNLHDAFMRFRKKPEFKWALEGALAYFIEIEYYKEPRALDFWDALYKISRSRLIKETENG